MSIKIPMVCWSSRSKSGADWQRGQTLACPWQSCGACGEVSGPLRDGWHFMAFHLGKSDDYWKIQDDLRTWVIGVIGSFEKCDDFPVWRSTLYETGQVARSSHARWRRSTGPSLRAWHSLFWSRGVWFKVGRGSAAAADDDDDFITTNIIMIMIISPSSLTH